MKPAAFRPALIHVSALGEFVRLLLLRGIAHVDRAACPGMEPALRQGCKRALEGLWRRRRPLTRLLGKASSVSQGRAGAADGSTRLSALDHATVGLHLAASRALRALLDQQDVEWRHLEEAANGDAGARLPWPPTPGLFAQAVRCAIEHATRDDALRLALMDHSITAAVPEYVALCHRVLTGGGVDVPLPPVEDVGAAVNSASVAPAGPASPLADVLPGQWFRMVLHRQWTDAQLTWRSHNGRFFMFSSPLAGQAHSLSRPALEGLIQRGHFEKRKAA